MNRTLKLAAILLSLCVAVPAIYAQEKCSLQTFAGTYVSYDRGSSLTIDLSSVGVLGPAPGAPPSPPAWVALGIVPFVNVAEVTYTADGVGDGYFWMFAGSVSATLEPIPVHITVTEMNEDCTGKLQYTLPNGAVIEERFIIFDNGRQYRSVPTTLASPGIPTLAWIGTGHRISKGRAPVNFCGPHTAHGRYLLTCENILRSGLYPKMGVADTFLLRSDISMEGDYTGVLYEKFGMKSIELPVYGTMTVNPDCSLTDTLNIPDISSTVILKGAFFNEGKEYYAMGILNPNRLPAEQDIKYSFCQGTRIGQ
ncbi:MAG TPA: hypothetical protein VF840_02255 [Terriglobales bacterium]